MLNKAELFVKSNPKEVFALGVFVVAITIFFIGNAFAVLTPTKSVIITSQKTSYEEKEPGSWQVEKSGKWISKGRARVTFDVDTTLMKKNKNIDIILVLDTSDSMNGIMIDCVKRDTIKLIDNLLSNENNNIALVTFNTGSTIVSDFTNDKDYLTNEINSIQPSGSTNYYQPLIDVDSLLKDYKKIDNKEVIVLFLTDGYPNVDSPNQIAQYRTLKKNYPYITINGIQYELGASVLTPIKEISDYQFIADTETLYDVLYEASVVPIKYNEFKIIDYIDNRYFTLDSVDDITMSQGNVKLEEENGQQKIIWTIDNLKSGSDVKLTMDINLNDDYIGQSGIYPTNESEEIISKISNVPDEDVVSTKTPVLADNYKVTYDGNSPDGSKITNVPETANYSVYDTVSISTNEPSCVGYEFKGWEIVNKTSTRVGEDYFIMPNEDVVIKAEWSKIEVSKTMDGVVNDMGDPIMMGSSWFDASGLDQNSVTSIVTKDDITIPSTAIKYWDVSEARDGSVIAYAEDDGRGNGTYKITIGGQGGVIGSTGSNLFFCFYYVETIDLTYFDTSQITSFASMFYRCNRLTSIVALDKFDTSKATNMHAMFYDCYALKGLNLSNFDTRNVTNMGSMFHANGVDMKLEYLIFGDKWSTSKVTNMSAMFENCTYLTTIDLSKFDTSNVTNMSEMFYGCEGVTTIDIARFDTRKVTNMSDMFRDCYNLTYLDFSRFDTSEVTTMKGMFWYCRSLTSIDVSRFDTSKVKNMSSMFAECWKLQSLDVSNFNTSNVTTMGGNLTRHGWSALGMFSDCRSLTTLNISNFDTSKVTNMNALFSECYNLKNITLGNNFDTSSVTNMSYMFEECKSLNSLDVTMFNTSKVTNMEAMFAFCEQLTSINLSIFNTSNVTNMSAMFNGCSSLGSLNLSNFVTNKVTKFADDEDYYGMFYKCTNLTYLDFRNASFDSAEVYVAMFDKVNNNINVVVKNSTVQSFVRARLDEVGKTNATVTIASRAVSTSLIEKGPRKFGPFSFGLNTLTVQ